MTFSPGDVGFSFELSEPFRPLEQLMGVLPPASRHALPPALQRLMTDEDSPS
jgi:5'-3' exoribonuclease 2